MRSRFPPPQDAACHGGVVRTLCDVIPGMDGDEVACIEGVGQGSQHAALWGPGAESEGCRGVGAYPHPLGAVQQEVLNPGAGVERWSQVCPFEHQSVRKYSVERRAGIHKAKRCQVSGAG